MILLQRKRLMIIIGAICISIFSYLMGSSNMYKTVETVSLPVSGKTVVLDAGHGRGGSRGRI
jgi:hypothetical protein